METQDHVELVDARLALASVAAQRRNAAGLLVTPRWYHPVLGVLVGGLMAIQSAHSWIVSGSSLVVYVLGLAALVTAYRRQTGVWVWGLRRGPAGRIALLLALLLEFLLGGAAALEFLAGIRGAFVGAGALAAVLVVVLGRRFDERLRAELS